MSEGRSKPISTFSFRSVSIVAVRHVRKHIGLGLVCSIAYFDPGNWGVDLQAGAVYGYRLLFIVLVAGLIATFLQVLATRLGCVTGLDLASHCRLLLHSHPRYPRLVRYLALYPLYAFSEIAIISTDLAELLGSAMALCMLIPKLQIWEGVLITAADVLFLLALKDPLRGRPVRVFELSMAILVLAVLICMCIIIIRVNVQWDLAFQGYLPSKYIFPNGAFYTSVGILGATVMPHSLFLGSALATQDRESSSSPPPIHPQPEVSDTSSSTSTVFISQDDSNATQKQPESHNSSRCKFLLIKFCRVIRLTRLILTQALKTLKSSYTVESIKTRHGDRENNSLDFVERHLYHGIVDVVGSLLGFAVIINSMILIISSAVFFYGNKTGQLKSTAGLFDAYDLIQVSIGEGAAKLFAIALLAAGQSSSIVATIAGQAVAEGFLRWRVSPVIRRLFTRVIAIIPSMVVAIVFGRPGIDALLVISQVILSVVLPFVTLPLLYLTSTKQIMTVKAIPAIQLSRHGKALDGHTQVVQSSPCATRRHLITNGCHDIHNETIETFNDPASTESRSAVENVEAHTHELDAVDFSNGLTTTFFACTVWLLIAAANVYVLVALGMGQS